MAHKSSSIQQNQEIFAAKTYTHAHENHIYKNPCFHLRNQTSNSIPSAWHTEYRNTSSWSWSRWGENRTSTAARRPWLALFLHSEGMTQELAASPTPSFLHHTQTETTFPSFFLSLPQQLSLLCCTDEATLLLGSEIYATWIGVGRGRGRGRGRGNYKTKTTTEALKCSCGTIYRERLLSSGKVPGFTSPSPCVSSFLPF